MSLIDTSGSTVVVWPPTQASSGTTKTFGLHLDLATVAPDRLAVTYNDGYGHAYVQDAGVFGSNIVLGRYTCAHHL